MELTNKLKILKNPRKKSARELLRDINKPGYEVTIENKGEIIVRIDKKNVPLSLNDKVGEKRMKSCCGLIKK